MARDDILLGVDLDVDAVTGKMDFLIDGFQAFAEQIGMAIDDFRDFERQAAEVGKTVEEFAGITRDAAEAYRDFDQAYNSLNRTLRADRITILSGAVRELGESFRKTQQLYSGFKDAITGEGSFLERAFEFRDQLTGGIGLRDVIRDPSQLFNAASNVFFGKAGLRVSDQEARNRAIAAERAAAIDQQEREALFNAKREAIGETDAEFQQRAARARAQFQQRARFRQERDEARARFSGINFDRFQAIDRETFLASQALQGFSGGSLDLQQRRQRIALEQFDLRQAAAKKKQEIREQTEAERATIQNQIINKQAKERLDDILRELQDRRNERVFEITDAETIEDI